MVKAIKKSNAPGDGQKRAAPERHSERGHLEFASLLCSDGEGKDQALAAPKAVVGCCI